MPSAEGEGPSSKRSSSAVTNVDDEDTQAYYVVINDEDQYSIWFEDRPVPAGWHKLGEPSSKAACLQRIETLWTDMRPRSLRIAMERDADIDAGSAELL
jgi:MbtH protein